MTLNSCTLFCPNSFLPKYSYMPLSVPSLPKYQKGMKMNSKYSKSLSWAENLNFLPKSQNNLFNFSARDSDLEYLFWRSKNPSVSSDYYQKGMKTFAVQVSLQKKIDFKHKIIMFSLGCSQWHRYYDTQWPCCMAQYRAVGRSKNPSGARSIVVENGHKPTPWLK